MRDEDRCPAAVCGGGFKVDRQGDYRCWKCGHQPPQPDRPRRVRHEVDSRGHENAEYADGSVTIFSPHAVD